MRRALSFKLQVRFLWEQMRGQCDGVSLEVELPAEAALEELVGLRMAEVWGGQGGVSAL